MSCKCQCSEKQRSLPFISAPAERPVRLVTETLVLHELISGGFPALELTVTLLIITGQKLFELSIEFHFISSSV